MCKPSIKKVVIVFASILFGYGCSTGEFTDLFLAEQLRQSKRFDEAIKIYENKIANNSNNKEDQGENIYFYAVIIGDLLIEQGKITEALLRFKEAEKHKVDPLIIADRIKQSARWFENHDQLENAIKVLESNREIDELTIDIELDRISRKIVERDEKKRKVDF